MSASTRNESDSMSSSQMSQSDGENEEGGEEFSEMQCMNSKKKINEKISLKLGDKFTKKPI